MKNQKTEHPLIYKKKIITSECVEALIRHGHYWRDSQSQLYFGYNGQHYTEVPEVKFEKKLFALVGENFSKKSREEVLSVFRARISTSILTETELPDGYINVENGILDLSTLVLQKHSPKFYFFNTIPIQYDPKATCDKWMNFLKDITLERTAIIDLLQEMFGYCLRPGNWLQAGFFLIGEGENGKSTLLEVLRAMLGKENTSSLSLGDLNERFRKVNLLNKYANICEESPCGRSIEAEVFKNLTAEGRVTVERKHKPAFEFNNKAKLIFATNEVPIIKDHTHAFYRRINVIPFDYTVPEEKKIYNLNKELIKELPGILNWAIQGLKRIIDDGRWTISDDIEKAKRDFIREGDTVKIFIDDSCELGTDKSALTSVLYHHYRDFCSAKGYKPVAENTFGSRLKTHVKGVERKRSSINSRPWIYVGINVTPEAIKDLGATGSY